MQANKIVNEHIGKWMRIEDEVENVREYDDSISVSLRGRIGENINLTFEKERWKEHLETMREGDKIIAEGLIRKIERFWIFLADCEVIKVYGAIEN